jgi:A/G-specific adenine glycosylase
LERRPPSGIWGGLWTFPQFDNHDDCIGYFGPPVASSQLPVYHHSFTHFDLELQPVVLRNVAQQLVADSDKHCWYDPANPLRIGLAKPVTDIIRELTSSDGALRHTLASSQ